MRYLGGKVRIAKDIAAIIKAHKKPEHTAYYEPFVGGAAVLGALADLGLPRYASDALPDIILMFQALQQGWVPPTKITEEEYLQLKTAEPSALRGFAGTQAAFGGMFFSGYARPVTDKPGHYRDWVGAGSRELIKALPGIRDAVFTCCSYEDINPQEPAIIYCDPPYSGTAKYKGTGDFDSTRFWDKVREWGQAGHTVIVSEYEAPADFTCLWSKPLRVTAGGVQHGTYKQEKVFIHNPAALPQAAPAPALEPVKPAKAKSPKKAKAQKQVQEPLPLPEAEPIPEGLITDVGEALEALKDCSKIGLDLETGGLSPQHDPIAVVSMKGDNGITAILHVRGSVPEELKAFLEREDILYIIHNGTNFDVPFTWAHGIYTPHWWDTLTMESLLDMQNRRDRSRSLKASVARRLKQTVSKELGQHSWMVPELTGEQYRYCKEDVEYLIELQEAQSEKARETGQQAAVELELAIAPAVAYMVLNGLPVDPDKWAGYVDKQKALSYEYASGLTDIFGEINLDSWQQVKKAYSMLGVDLPDTTSATIEALASGHDDPEIRRIAQLHLNYKDARQRVKMYGEMQAEGRLRDNRLRGNFWQAGTDTGRFSSSNPNLQQVPRDMREVFVAPPGYKVVGVDYAAIEARIAFIQANDTAGIEACKQEDIHLYVAALLFEEVRGLQKLAKLRELTSEEKARLKLRRQQAKAAVFRLIFGGGWKGLPAYARAVYGVDMSLEEAEAINNAFFGRFEGIRAKKSQAYQRAAQGGGVKIRLPHGLMRIIAGKMLQATRLLNTMVQGTAGGGMKWGIRLAVEEGLHKYLAATVHDELVAVVPEDEALDYAVALAECMIRGMYRVIRKEMPVEVSVAISDYWTKQENYKMGPDFVLRWAEGPDKGRPVQEPALAA